MKPYSLRFYSGDLEIKFQDENFRDHLSVFWRNMFCYGCLAFLLSMYSFSLGQWQLGITCLVYSLQIPLVYKIAERSPKCFDFCCFTFQTALQFGEPFCLMMGFLNQGVLHDADSYLIGQGITQMVLSQNQGTRFYLKVMIIMLNMILQMMIKFQIRKEFTGMTLMWLVSNFMILNYLYWEDRIKREAFLAKHNKKLWQQEIGECAKICIITCVSEDGKILLDFNQCNSVSQKEFNISDQDSLRRMLLEVKLIPKKQFNSRMECALKQQKGSKKFINLYNQVSIISKQFQTESEEFIGLHGTQMYEIKIFATWNDQQLNIHILMNKLQKQEEDNSIKILRNERQLLDLFRKKFGQSIKIILIKLQIILLPNNQSNNQKQIKSILSIAYDSLRQNYNLQLFLNPQYVLHKNLFLIYPLIKKINEIVQDNQTISSNRVNIECHIDPDLKLYSCQRTLFHILFNLYSIIIGSTNQPIQMTVYVQQNQTSIGSVIMLRISTNLTSLMELMDGKNYHRYYPDYYKYVQTQAQIEMINSKYLVAKIGPCRTIEICDNEINFSIFQDLKILDV